MPDDFIRKQLEKLLEGKALLILDSQDFEELILAAVPALRSKEQELLREGRVFDARRLGRIANELDTAPSPKAATIINISTNVH